MFLYELVFLHYTKPLMKDELLGQRRIYAHGQVVLFKVSKFQTNIKLGKGIIT